MLRNLTDVEMLASQFESAHPFPHVVIEDALDEGSEMLEVYPEPDWDGWHNYTERYQDGKKACSDVALIPSPLAELIHELSAPKFLKALETITGIPRLLVDPYLDGGGLHMSGPGGILTPHTDFHFHPFLGLYRRVNVLVYLNIGWDQSFGGCLELFAPGQEKPASVVVPTWGTMVIFRTDDGSRHGFSVPVKDPHWRRSVALYYYTAAEASSYSGDSSTYWNALPLKGFSNRVTHRIYRLLRFASRTFATLAYRVDPNNRIQK